MEEMAFEPPRRKNEACWSRREVSVISVVDSVDGPWSSLLWSRVQYHSTRKMRLKRR